MAERPWYREGLRFRCTGCGDCCTGEPGYVWVDQDEIQTLAAVVGLPLDEFVDGYTRRLGDRVSLIERANGECVFFDAESRQCRVYDCRPRQCRTWPFWESNLTSPADWAETARGCPGIGQGPLVRLEEIESQVRRIQV